MVRGQKSNLVYWCQHSPWRDELLPWLYRTSDPLILETLALFLNYLMFYKCIPASWKKARIYLLYKEVANYRPISLLLVLYKVYTSIINARLVTVIERNGLQPKSQNGFRKEREATMNIQMIARACQQYRGKELYSVY